MRFSGRRRMPETNAIMILLIKVQKYPYNDLEYPEASCIPPTERVNLSRVIILQITPRGLGVHGEPLNNFKTFRVNLLKARQSICTVMPPKCIFFNYISAN